MMNTISGKFLWGKGSTIIQTELTNSYLFQNIEELS